MWWSLVVALVLVGGGCSGGTGSSPEYDFPKLYHLDDYDRCRQSGGVYCIGTFQLTQRHLSHTYQALKSHSASPLKFDRTLLHRGFCVSERCHVSLRNSTSCFEHYMQKQAEEFGLRAELQSHRCDAYEQNNSPDVADWAFLWCTGLLLFLNCLGTLYDLTSNGKKDSHLFMAWSIRANMQRLTATYADGDQRLAALAPIQGFRVLLMVLVIITHAAQITHKLCLHNPDHLEQLFHHPLTMLIRNGSSAVQVLVVLSNFLFAYSLLLLAKNRKLGFSHLPMFLLQRLIRLMPVHLVMVGYAATWWKRAGDGPQWGDLVEAESDVCRRKFWLHSLLLHNLADNDEHCLLQTWFLAVDFQLFMVAAVIMLTGMRLRRRAVLVLTALFSLACLLNAVLAYANGWQSLLHVTAPESVRLTFRGVPSFRNLYISPVGSLPACLLGLLVAHIHYDMQERGYKIEKNKLFVWSYHLSIPLLLVWIMSGVFLYERTSPLVTTTYVAVERPVFAILSAICLLGAINNIDNPVRRVMGWRGWQALGRMSLSALMLHWCVNKTIVSSRRVLTEVSVISIASDIISTCFLTYCLAVPATVLVETPLIRSLTAIMTRT